MDLCVFRPIAVLVFVHRTPQFDLSINDCIVSITWSIFVVDIPHALEGMETSHFLIDPVWALIGNGWTVHCFCLARDNPLIPERDAIWFPIKLCSHASKLAVQNGPGSIGNYFAG